MTGSAPSDVPLSSPGEEDRSLRSDPASQRRAGKRKKSNLPSKASSCVLDYAREEVNVVFTGATLKGPPTSFTRDNVKDFRGSGQKSHHTAHVL